MPALLKGSSARARASRAAWDEMHRAGDEAADAERRLGVNSREAVSARRRARAAQEELLTLNGLSREELVAKYSWTTARGRDAIALGRY